jgi:hypothetical protein
LVLVTKLTAVLIAIGTDIPASPRLNGRYGCQTRIAVKITVETAANASTASP